MRGGGAHGLTAMRMGEAASVGVKRQARPAASFTCGSARPIRCWKAPSRPTRSAQLAAEAGMPAVALTDRANLFGALEFSVATKEAGVQPIIGCALPVTGIGEGPRDRWAKTPTIVLLAQNEQGYANLSELSSAAFLEVDPADEPQCRLGQGLRARRGPDPALRRPRRAGRSAVRRRQGQGRPRGAGRDAPGLRRPLLRRAAAPRDWPPRPPPSRSWWPSPTRPTSPLVATNDVYFKATAMHLAHDALLCIADGAFIGQDERRRVTAEHWFKSAGRHARALRRPAGGLRQHPRHRPALRLRGAQARPDPAALPHRGRPLGERRAGPPGPRGPEGPAGDQRRRRSPLEVYEERLEKEIGVITSMGFAGYFLIVSDFMKWAVAHGVPVGPGRGSGAGSLVAWSLMITGLDPLKYGLIFERFLNPERVSMPDFDIDFCQERRDEVITYVQQRYGRDRVAQIITFGTLQARAVLRDVGRVLQLPLGQVDRLAKMVPANPANPVTLAKAIEIEPRLRQARDDDEGGGAPAGHRPAARGPLPQRLDPRRRHRHLRPAADPARAALPRSALGPAGQPVQHEVGGKRRPGEVRLPGPEDPDRRRPGHEAPGAPRRGLRAGDPAAGRRRRPTR